MTTAALAPLGADEAERGAAAARAVVEQLGRVVLGQDQAVRDVVAALVARGHVLLEGVPGTAKTLLVRTLSRVLRLEFRRIQFTPDLMPSDITGVNLLAGPTGTFAFRPGPIFGDLVLGDEINRAPAKTQAALLEAMQERQVTLDGTTRPLEQPFLVLATQNPIEYEGTYPLPEAQLDRFLIRLAFGYPSRDDEQRMVAERLGRRSDDVALDVVVDRPTLVEMQAAVERVHLSSDITAYIVDIVAATRAARRVQIGASPRGTLALVKLTRARAAVRGRDFVTPDDVKAVAVPALAHRLMLPPELWVKQVRAEEVVQECLAEVPTPAIVPAESMPR
jgi:MoxR-like ATPase